MSVVRCPKCRTEIKLSDRLYGRKVACKCGTVLRMPKAPVEELAAPNPIVTASLPPIRFQCPTCFETLQVNGDLAGQISQCPCGTQIRVPSPAPVPASFHDPLNIDLPNEAGNFAPVAPAPTDPFAPVQSYSNDPLANDPFFSAAPVGIDPLTGQPVGIPNVAPKYRKPTKKALPTKVVRRKAPKQQSGGLFEGEVIGGALAMIGAVVWFVGGLAAGYIFFYPPILFFIGLAGVIKGVLKN